MSIETGTWSPQLVGFDLRTEQEAARFSCWIDALFSFLRIAIPTYYGDDFHRELLERHLPYVTITTLNSTIIGASYVAHSGRRCLTAVHPHHRFRGIAKSMVSTSLEVICKQFSMVEMENKAIIATLENCGFCRVDDEDRLKTLLHNESHLIKRIYRHEDALCFSRSCEFHPGNRNNLIVLESDVSRTHKND